jgi:hypothetical protein
MKLTFPPIEVRVISVYLVYLIVTTTVVFVLFHNPYACVAYYTITSVLLFVLRYRLQKSRRIS